MIRAPARAAAALVIFCSGLAPAWGEDLLQIWNAAIQRDPLYAAAQASRNADQERVPQARAQLMPWVSADAAAEVEDVRRTSDLSHAQTRHTGLWALTLTQPVVDIGRWDQLKQSQYIARTGDVALEQARQDLILRVTESYFDVLAAQDTLDTILAQKEAVNVQLQAAQRGFELGATTVTDTHEAQARLDLLNASELQARNALQVAHDQLAKIIDQRPGKLAPLASSTALPAPEPHRIDDWTDQASRANLAVTRAQLTAQIVEKNIDIARSGHYPSLSLYAQTGTASNRGIYGQRNGPRSLDSAVGLQLSIPLYSGGGISSQVREQTSRLQQARYEFEAARREAVRLTREHFSGVTSGLAQIQALRAAEQSSLAALEANKIGYEIGVRINIDVLNAQQQLFETRRALARARYDTLLHSLRLKAAGGMLSDADIVAVNQLLDSAQTPLNP